MIKKSIPFIVAAALSGSCTHKEEYKHEEPAIVDAGVEQPSYESSNFPEDTSETATASEEVRSLAERLGICDIDCMEQRYASIGLAFVDNISDTSEEAAEGISRRAMSIITSISNPSVEVEEPSVDELRQLIVSQYPELVNQQGINDFEAIGDNSIYESDPVIQVYLRTATYHDLLEDGVVKPNHMIEQYTYLNPRRMWERKVNMARNHRHECEVARDNLAPFNVVDTMNMESLHGVYEAAVERVNANLPANLNSIFVPYIDANLLLAITIHELIPTGYHNDYARIAILRTLLDEGLRVEAIPAQFDRILSFGPFQMTTIPYEGRSTRHRYNNDGEVGSIERYLEDFGLPERLHDCVELEDQAVAAMLLKVVNMNRFVRDFQSNAVFMDLFEAASEHDRRVFIASVLAASHHAPGRADYGVENSLRNISSVSTLQEFRDLYVQTIRNRGGRYGDAYRMTARHAQRSSELVDVFLSDSDESISTPREIPSFYEIGMTNMLERERNGASYFTFNLQGSRLDVIGLLCEAGMESTVQVFNPGVDLNGDGVINIPVFTMKPTLRGAELTRYRFIAGADIQAEVQNLIGNHDINSVLPFNSVSSWGELSREVLIPTRLLSELAPENDTYNNPNNYSVGQETGLNGTPRVTFRGRNSYTSGFPGDDTDGRRVSRRNGEDVSFDEANEGLLELRNLGVSIVMSVGNMYSADFEEASFNNIAAAAESLGMDHERLRLFYEGGSGAPSEDSKENYDAIISTVANCLLEGNCVVHCREGINRSVNTYAVANYILTDDVNITNNDRALAMRFNTTPEIVAAYRLIGVEVDRDTVRGVGQGNMWNAESLLSSPERIAALRAGL